MDNQRLTALLEAQQELISKIALGTSLQECLTSTCALIEAIISDKQARASILLLEGNQLRHGAAPSIHPEYCQAIDGVVIGSGVGSCGTATHEKRQVIVTDIATDPLWKDYKEVALGYDLEACWSNPIFSSSGEVLGSFAIYYTHPKKPEPFHLELIDRFTHLASLAIEKSYQVKREKALSDNLKRSTDKLTTFTNVMPDLGLIIDEEGCYVDIYGAHSDLIVSGSKDLIGKKIMDVLPSAEAASVMEVIQKALMGTQVEIFEYNLLVPKGLVTFEGRVSLIDHYNPDFPDKKHVLWLARDITERKQAEQEIEKLAFYDPLTGLANRRLLNEHLRIVIEKAHRQLSKSVLLYMDLDDFKRINDSLGHSVGDRLLVQVANRLKPSLTKSDTIARIGGDEFVVILEENTMELETIIGAASILAQNIISLFDESFSIDGRDYKIGVSIGLSVVQGANETADEVLKRADTAMYRSKRIGGNAYTFFDPALQKTLDDKLAIEQGLLKAIKEGQLTAHFQPQVDLSGKIIGAEALVRWIHPDKGFISPLEFIPIAEQFGLITDVQDIILSQSCELLKTLASKKLINKDFNISINISPSQFRNPNFKQELKDSLNNYCIQPSQIKLEITEGMLIDNVEAAIKQMKELKSLGFDFSVDDFGTGYSSLTYLHTFPIDELKIDKSFIDRLDDQEAGLGIVDAIISLSRHLNFSIVAEGVEDEKQRAILTKREIDSMQGYLFSRPLPSDELINLLKES